MLFIGVLIPVLFSTADEEMLVAPMLALIWEELSFVSPIEWSVFQKIRCLDTRRAVM